MCLSDLAADGVALRFKVLSNFLGYYMRQNLPILHGTLISAYGVFNCVADTQSEIDFASSDRLVFLLGRA